MTDDKPAKAKPATTRLAVADPWCTKFTFPETTAGTLVIDRTGVEVPLDEAPALIDIAAKHGVTITEVSDES